MSQYQESSDDEYYIEDYNSKKKCGKHCGCKKCLKNKRNCVFLASKYACSPYDDIKCPQLGQLWIRDTDLMYVYQRGCDGDLNWHHVPNGKVLSFYFVSTVNSNAVAYVSTNGTAAQIVRTFVFPDSFDGLGGRVRQIEYSHSWSESVDNPTVDGGMLLTIRDKYDKQSVIIAQNIPSEYESFSTSSDVLYQPNPGDILEIVIQKPPNQLQPGQGRLHCLKIYLCPFNPD